MGLIKLFTFSAMPFLNVSNSLPVEYQLLHSFWLKTSECIKIKGKTRIIFFIQGWLSVEGLVKIVIFPDIDDLYVADVTEDFSYNRFAIFVE